MTTASARPEPTWEVIGAAEPLSDDALSALARLLVDLAEAEEDTDAEDEAQEGTATVPQPARPRTTWRTRRRKEPRAKHYVPNDI